MFFLYRLQRKIQGAIYLAVFLCLINPPKLYHDYKNHTIRLFDMKYDCYTLITNIDIRYILLIAELKEGTCPIPQSNSTGICIEECQMDANCTEARKCCFNGCGHSCQNTGGFQE